MFRRKPLGDADPDRIFVGHGSAITGDARWRFRRAIVEQAPGQRRALLQARD